MVSVHVDRRSMSTWTLNSKQTGIVLQRVCGAVYRSGYLSNTTHTAPGSPKTSPKKADRPKSYPQSPLSLCPVPKILWLSVLKNA
jgi:hypothetical protein